MSVPIAYTVFHINMAFSSIEEEYRPTVIERCYWPLLRLAEEGFPIGIEATSYSLRAIMAIDPSWIERLRKLIHQGKIEFVGSGYTQMIAPLVPAEVTRWNLKLGCADYMEILGVKPKIALVNEQAYAPGLVPLYLDAGFEAIMMDWAEPASHNKSWKRAYSHTPQVIEGVEESIITVLWSDAISFQKFQRYAHGELDAEEYIEFLSLQLDDGFQAFPLYTSDAEIFDYRPGRFSSETGLGEISEYERIRLLLEALKNSEYVRLALPDEALKYQKAGCSIKLETVSAPVPVKKQRKYNVLRWAVSGQSDLSLNTHCWRLYEKLKGQPDAREQGWRTLCGLWASDFRTHITEKRWHKLNEALPSCTVDQVGSSSSLSEIPDTINVEQGRRFLVIETSDVHLVLNLYRGLALQSFGFGAYAGTLAGAPESNGLIGTLAHGFYKDIAYGADFYTGHFVFEPAGRHKVTDLVRVTPRYGWLEDTSELLIECDFETPWGPITKSIKLNTSIAQIGVEYSGAIPLPLDGSFRLGHITLNPNAFDASGLYYSSHNGGDVEEVHMLGTGGGLLECDHGASVSRLISATTGLGMTKGYVEIGDNAHFVRLSMNRTDAAGIGLVTSKCVDDSYFVRAAISLCEVDETLRRSLPSISSNVARPEFKYSVQLGKHS